MGDFSTIYSALFSAMRAGDYAVARALLMTEMRIDQKELAGIFSRDYFLYSSPTLEALQGRLKIFKRLINDDVNGWDHALWGVATQSEIINLFRPQEGSSLIWRDFLHRAAEILFEYEFAQEEHACLLLACAALPSDKIEKYVGRICDNDHALDYAKNSHIDSAAKVELIEEERRKKQLRKIFASRLEGLDRFKEEEQQELEKKYAKLKRDVEEEKERVFAEISKKSKTK